jgi:hypothetical protein
VAYTFFGIQVAIAATMDPTLHGRLRGVIAAGAERQSLADKRVFWRRVTTAVNAGMPGFTTGYWDLIREDHADKEYESWCSQIEGSEGTTGGVGEPVLLVTLAFLLERGSNSDLTLGARCDLPEREWFTRLTFARLVGVAPALNFANVQSDAVYLMPGTEEGQLTTGDLAGEGYEYLRALS